MAQKLVIQDQCPNMTIKSSKPGHLEIKLQPPSNKSNGNHYKWYDIMLVM